MLAAACAVLAADASAGTYSVYSCVGPSGETLPNDAWVSRQSVASHAGAFTFGTACSGLTAASTAGTTLAAGEDAGYSFVAPAGTTISGYLVRRSVTVAYPASGTRPTLSAGLRRTVAGAETYWGECEAATANCSVPASGTQSSGLSASSLQLGVECVQTTSSCAGAGITTLKATLIDSRVDLTDNNAPTVALTGGTLPGASGSSGQYSLGVRFTDVGAGVKRYWLEVDGVKSQVTNLSGSCDPPYTQIVSCPTQQTVSYAVDLAAYSPGSHTATAVVLDAAGNTGTLAPVVFTVPGIAGSIPKGGGSFEANGTPAVSAPRIATRRKVVEAKAGRSVAVRGVLKTTAGAAIAGATLDVTALSLGLSSSATNSLGTTKTAKDGSFSFKVKPKGARLISFSFRPASSSASTATATTIVRQKLTFTAKRSRATLSRGTALIVSGRLSGTAGAVAGAPVEMQVLAGKKWIAIETVRASKSGAYKWKHRFTRVTRPTLFRFRAVVRAKQGWPWPSKSSPMVQVLVNP